MGNITGPIDWIRAVRRAYNKAYEAFLAAERVGPARL